MTPPTWRALAARARRLGLELVHGCHEACLCEREVSVDEFASWRGRRRSSIILRTAVAAALEQLEKRR